MIRRHSFLLLGFLLFAACDKPRESGTARETDTKSGPRETKRIRPAVDPGSEQASLDPRQALERAESVVERGQREKELSQLAWDTLESDPEVSSLAFGKLASDSVERIRLIQHFAMRRAEENPDEAMKWAESLGSEKEIATAKCQIALVLAENEPLKAAGMLSDSGIVGREFDVALVQVVQRWAGKSPADAAAWAVNFKPGEARSASIREIVSRWIEKDPAAVFSWKSGLSDPSIQQEITSALVEAAAGEPGGATPKWLDVADEETRNAVRKTEP